MAAPTPSVRECRKEKQSAERRFMAFYLMALYVTPDQVMPVASVVATVLGVLLIFWQKFLALLRSLAGRLKGPK